jgi:hypothetical protein
MDPINPNGGIGLNPIMHQNGPLTSFQQTGNSHISHVGPGGHNPGFHVTTQVPGIGAGEGLNGGLNIHDPVNNMNFGK